MCVCMYTYNRFWSGLTLIFFHKVVHHCQDEKLRLNKLLFIFKLFQQCHDFLYTVSCLFSLDFRNYLNLDCLLKLFRCSKGDVCRILVTSLWIIPAELPKENAARSHDEVVDNLDKVEAVENESNCDLINL